VGEGGREEGCDGCGGHQQPGGGGKTQVLKTGIVCVLVCVCVCVSVCLCV